MEFHGNEKSVHNNPILNIRNIFRCEDNCIMKTLYSLNEEEVIDRQSIKLTSDHTNSQPRTCVFNGSTVDKCRSSR